MNLKALLAAAALMLALPAIAQVHVKGYTRKDGTYVAPHYRSSPNTTKADNYSARGNYNPYTGKRGSVDPYAAPTYQPRTYQSQPYVPAYKPPPRASYYVTPASTYAPPAQPARYTAPPAQAYFGGNRCTYDCSGHTAGYDWAEENGITDSSECGGNSQSFVEGCETYADEQQSDY